MRLGVNTAVSFYKLGFGEVFCFFKINGRYMQLPSSLRGPFALISTRSGTRLVEYSFAHFLTRLEKTSPSVQCVAKCRRSQMSIPEAGYPHMAVCLEDRKHAGRTVLYCMIGN